MKPLRPIPKVEIHLENLRNLNTNQYSSVKNVSVEELGANKIRLEFAASKSADIAFGPGNKVGLDFSYETDDSKSEVNVRGVVSDVDVRDDGSYSVSIGDLQSDPEKAWSEIREAQERRQKLVSELMKAFRGF